MWYRPKFNIPFFCSWLPEFCLRDMRDPRSYFMFFLIFLKTIFLSLFHELLPRLRPYSVDESLTKLPTDDELCYFYFFKLLPCPSSNAWDIAILFIFIMNYYHHFSNNIVVVKLPLLVLLKTGKSQKMKACLSAFYLRTCPKHLTRFIGLYC